MHKHTPGPWVVDPDSTTDISPADDLRLGIATISHADEAGGRWLFGEQSTANAKLIAAAPDLLAELEETHAALCFTANYIGTERYRRNSAAIAKATQ